MTTSSRQIPADRVTRAIFEHASLIARGVAPIRILVGEGAVGSEQYDDITVVGLRVRA